MSGQQIVKVQLSIESTEPERMTLMYNEDRSWMFEAEANQAILDIMGERPKAYFYAQLRGDGQVELMAPAPDQDW